MTAVHRDFSPGDLSHPDCVCRRRMRLRTIEPVQGDSLTTIHTFECDACGHVLKVMNEFIEGVTLH